MKLPTSTVIQLQNSDGSPLLEAELLVMNALLTQAQAGLDTSDSLSTEVWSSRYAVMLEDKFGCKLTSTQAWLIADAVSMQLKRLQADFFA
jgi:hypothetical protein